MSVRRSKAPDEGRLVGYLLGRLTEEEQERVESFYFGDAENLELLAAVEDELIDGYVRGELGPLERERFEDFFLRSPERRERVETAVAFDAFVKKTAEDVSVEESSAASAPRPAPPTHTRFKRAAFWLPLAACLLLTSGGAFLVYKMLAARPEAESAQTRPADADKPAQPTPQQRPTPQQQPTPRPTAPTSTPRPTAARPTTPQHGSVVASILLTAGASRGGGASQTLTIGPEADRVRLLADVSNQGYQSYEAVLRTEEGAEVWRGGVKPAGRKKDATVIVLTPPARVFRSGDYTLSLAGLRADGSPDAVGEYQFRVSRR
jgi:anti-sigma factor RsiW